MLHPDIDPTETAEWVEALEAVIRNDGPDRARQLLEEVFADARLRGLHPAEDLSTPYVNTIPAAAEVPVPGDHDDPDPLIPDRADQGFRSIH